MVGCITAPSMLASGTSKSHVIGDFADVLEEDEMEKLPWIVLMGLKHNPEFP